MEDKTIYYISEAAKKVQVESHVLRYWEDELKLPIKRNEMGHRYYTDQDIKQLQQIKLLKEQGLQLKAIRTVLFKIPPVSGGSKGQQIMSEAQEENLMDVVKESVQEKAEEKNKDKEDSYAVALPGEEGSAVQQKQEDDDTERKQKAARLQYLLQHMITEAVRSANRELCTDVKESIIKELDYQFRMQEERDEERWKQEEEHYRRIDEMIRDRHKLREKPGKNKKKV